MMVDGSRTRRKSVRRVWRKRGRGAELLQFLLLHVHEGTSTQNDPSSIFISTLLSLVSGSSSGPVPVVMWRKVVAVRGGRGGRT